jgi:hypothetical protein
MQEMLLSSVVLYAPCCTVRFCGHECIFSSQVCNTVLVRLGAEHVILQEAGQDIQYIPCTVLGTATGAGWTKASSFAWLGKPFAEACIDNDCPFAMQELVDEVKQVRLNVTLCTIIC